jgi:hypothetical protein
MYGPYGTRSALLARASRAPREERNFKNSSNMQGAPDQRQAAPASGCLLWRVLFSIMFVLTFFAFGLVAVCLQ